MTVSTTVAANLSNSDVIGERLEQINETLASISAKQVLFIITLSFIAILVAFIFCLQLLERRKKKKQISVPSSIVIQPNHVKSKKNRRHDKSKNISSQCENDVLPSKSMKMKVAITPSMTFIKKPRVSSKEIVPEETKTEMSSKADSSKATASTSTSQVEIVEKKATPATVEPDVTTAVEPVKSPAGDASATSTASVMAPPAPMKNATVSQSSDSIISFTVPEGPLPKLPWNWYTFFPEPSGPPVPKKNDTVSSESKISFTVPEDTSSSSYSPRSLGSIFRPPATPTATTLSGISTTTSEPPEKLKDKIIGSVTTAKDNTMATTKSPMIAPTASVAPPEALPAPPVSPILITTPPPPPSEKKI